MCLAARKEDRAKRVEAMRASLSESELCDIDQNTGSWRIVEYRNGPQYAKLIEVRGNDLAKELLETKLALDVARAEVSSLLTRNTHMSDVCGEQKAEIAALHQTIGRLMRERSRNR
jgi:hypothetical protein